MKKILLTLQKLTSFVFNFIFFIFGLLAAIMIETIVFTFNNIKTIINFIFDMLENAGKSLSMFVKFKCDYEKFTKEIENKDYI